MPLYGFQCDNGHEFEKAVPLADFRVPQLCNCGEVAKRIVSAPHVISDSMEPMLGLDGKYYDSVSGYQKSTGANGEKLHVIDGPDTTKFEKPKATRKEIRDAIKAGIQDVKYGRVKPLVNIGETP